MKIVHILWVYFCLFEDVWPLIFDYSVLLFGWLSFIILAYVRWLL
uniref:Uncharacterized protein n=1 Tax=Rhizophora mucronata TaxID=61149 RepID=A0A2P2QZE5_RHIMU